MRKRRATAIGVIYTLKTCNLRRNDRKDVQVIWLIYQLTDKEVTSVTFSSIYHLVLYLSSLLSVEITYLWGWKWGFELHCWKCVHAFFFKLVSPASPCGSWSSLLDVLALLLYLTLQIASYITIMFFTFGCNKTVWSKTPIHISSTSIVISFEETATKLGHEDSYELYVSYFKWVYVFCVIWQP